MGRTAFPARRIRLAITAVVAASWLFWLFFILLPWWPIRLFFMGFMATGGTAVFMADARRRRGDRQALIPCVIGAVGVVAQFILTSRTPQPLTLAGCVGLAVAAIAWAVRLLTLLAGRRAAAVPVVRSAKDQEGA